MHALLNVTAPEGLLSTIQSPLLLHNQCHSGNVIMFLQAQHNFTGVSMVSRVSGIFEVRGSFHEHNKWRQQSNQDDIENNNNTRGEPTCASICKCCARSTIHGILIGNVAAASKKMVERTRDSWWRFRDLRCQENTIDCFHVMENVTVSYMMDSSSRWHQTRWLLTSQCTAEVFIASVHRFALIVHCLSCNHVFSRIRYIFPCFTRSNLITLEIYKGKHVSRRRNLAS